MTVAEIMQQAEKLTVDERRDLVKLLTVSLQREANSAQHSILELAGLGADIWKDVDVQAYIDELRDEWDS